MFTLYHIPGKKWGCTKQKLSRRLWEQGYSINDIDRVITIGNIDKAAEMERELNLEYGYSWKKSEDYRNITKLGAENRKCVWTNEDRMRGAIKGGRTAVESGQLKSVAHLGGKAGGSLGGKTSSQIERKCPNCGRFGRGNRFVSHIKKCIK